NDVRLIVQKAPAQREKAQGGERPLVLAEVELVGGELFNNKPVERQILVERADNVVAVRVGVGVAAFLLENVALGVGVTGDIEPVPSPTLAVAGRTEQAVHDFGKSFGRS